MYIKSEKKPCCVTVLGVDCDKSFGFRDFRAIVAQEKGAGAMKGPKRKITLIRNKTGTMPRN